LRDIPDGWDPHKTLDFAKAVFSGIVAEETARTKKEEDVRTKFLNQQIDQAYSKLEKIKVNPDSFSQLVKDNLAKDLNELQSDLHKIHDYKGERLAKLAQQKWYNEGEKSNKYFLGILNMRQNQKLIQELIDEEGNILKEKKEVEEHVRKFYEDLYNNSKCQVDIKDNSLKEKIDDYFRLAPKLKEESSKALDAVLTIDELEKALKSCKDSTPGPDGISYAFYKKFWHIWGKIIQEAWTYSMDMGILNMSNRMSIITLLPKEGKDEKKISNWRPISLSNCDLKICTKALAIRLGTHSEEIIHSNQTAYVPGRSVMDNLRTLQYYARQKLDKIGDRIIISLDAKKAFDSINHKFIDTTLEKYGFGQYFRDAIKMLYSELKAEVMVNGWRTKAINIRNGVKQGDALSCILFILCIDPLLRTLNSKSHISVTGMENDIAFAYADDINAIAKDNPESVKNIFIEYETEILRIKNDHLQTAANSGSSIQQPESRAIIQRGRKARKTTMTPHRGVNQRYPINTQTDEEKVYITNYNNECLHLKEKKEIKICGITITPDTEAHINKNITSKIEKLKTQLNKWKCRNLTILGKILIVKTFGLSQIIYNMQCCVFPPEELKRINDAILDFIWKKKDHKKRVERIARINAIKPVDKGGIGMPDIETLQESLALRQAIRAAYTLHPIKKIQQNMISPGLRPINTNEEISSLAQKTIIDLALDQLMKSEKKDLTWVRTIKLTDLYKILKVNGMAMLYAKKLEENGLTTIQQILGNNEENFKSKIQLATSQLNKKYPDLKKVVLDLTLPTLEFRLTSEFGPVTLDGSVTVKSLRSCILGKRKDINNPIVIERYYPEIAVCHKKMLIALQQIARLTSVKLRDRAIRSLNGNIVTGKSLFEMKISEDSSCRHCGQLDDRNHAILECEVARKGWENFRKLYYKISGKKWEITLTNVLGIGDNYNSQILTTLIIEMQRQILRRDLDGPVNRKWIINMIKNITEVGRKARNRIMKAAWDRLNDKLKEYIRREK
jgi:hypothetical protein